MNEEISEQLPRASTDDQPNNARSPIKTDKERTENKRRSRVVQVISALGLVVIAFLLWHFLGDKSEKAATRTHAELVPVELAAATTKDVPVQIRSIGNVEALSTVSVRSQIEGVLQRVHFVPGQEIKKGDLLFTIDPRPQQAALSQAEANLVKAMAAVRQGQDIVARDQATANNSRLIAKRDGNLVEAGVISREEYDNAVAKAQSDEATVRSDQSAVGNLQAAVKAEQANVNNAKVQLSYTTIRSPLTGKTGNLVMTAGNLIRANDTTPMVTVTQTAPIYVTFSVPEQDLLRIRQYASASGFRVEVVIPGDTADPAQGKLSLVDNTVDTSTGTIRLKATFENSDRKLFPGLFVNVVLTLGTQHDATVVPSQAVQIGQDNSFIYVVTPDMSAEVRNVKTGASVEGMTVIEQGVQAGERVVTDGQLRLVPGAKVQPKSGPGGRGNQDQKDGPSSSPNPGRTGGNQGRGSSYSGSTNQEQGIGSGSGMSRGNDKGP